MTLQLVLGLVGIGIVSLLVFFLVRNEVVHRIVVCPRKKTSCEVDVLRRGFCGDGEALRVKSCTAFANPRCLDCEQECLESLEE